LIHTHLNATSSSDGSNELSPAHHANNRPFLQHRRQRPTSMNVGSIRSNLWQVHLGLWANGRHLRSQEQGHHRVWLDGFVEYSRRTKCVFELRALPLCTSFSKDGLSSYAAQWPSITPEDLCARLKEEEYDFHPFWCDGASTVPTLEWHSLHSSLC
jgi:hypothetical protein